ncbi:alpha/beta hydrolase [Alkalibaculum sp. M08DMB]|uniref:Alpha/beta hydrolase n=1 Tax=Alkalibaculum sporogenes TaxID=2655001 RepID=A0A6A7KD67_9FIRM|nr:alpha/beta hydrolase [Alkalibaculum sporogenes]
MVGILKTIYKSEEGKNKILSLYDKQLERLSIPYKDLFVDTSFGSTHIIETGNFDGVPLLVFHGGNATSAYNLLVCNFLLKNFHIYSVDTIGHPGRSAEVSLSPNNYEYGKWASEVITNLNYTKIACFAGSFGAGILAKTMCVAPEKIEKAVLYVPAGINNAPAINSVRMMYPMIMYWITHKQKWLEKCIMPMAVTKENIDKDIFETAKCSIDYAKIKAGMPSNVKGSDLRKCKASTLVLAGEYDCLFPAKRVIPRANKYITHCTTYLIKKRGHINVLTKSEKQMIIDFLL